MGRNEVELTWAWLRALHFEGNADQVSAANEMTREWQKWNDLGELMDSGSAEAVEALVGLAVCARSEPELDFLAASLGEEFVDGGGSVDELLKATRARAPMFVPSILSLLLPPISRVDP